MILRRLTQHIKAQNWFAVVLDFIIVVVGVFVGLQVSNWNASRQGELSREYYLERLATDLSQTIALSESLEESALKKSAIIERFTVALNDTESQADELVAATRSYLSEGTQLIGFGIIWGTYEDLSSTGNFSVLQNQKLVERLINLSTFFDYMADSYRVNSDWILPFDTSLASEFDWMRYEDKTAQLFPVLTLEEQSAEIRVNATLLRRHAALHHWFLDYSVRANQDSIAKSRQVLGMVQGERGIFK
ncbi:hypothetical protein [Halioxenophilus aromaticivorans]|uniref:Uncharacterized protein n=1 Tax=Halioxenophilus aromaticivorans TaxID=1306992 RepID=A0AAV3U212_9ALTE